MTDPLQLQAVLLGAASGRPRTECDYCTGKGHTWARCNGIDYAERCQVCNPARPPRKLEPKWPIKAAVAEAEPASRAVYLMVALAVVALLAAGTARQDWLAEQYRAEQR